MLEMKDKACNDFDCRNPVIRKASYLLFFLLINPEISTFKENATERNENKKKVIFF